MMDKTKTIKSGQEQAVASWINYLNQVLLNQMNEVLKQEQSNLNEAMATINETLNKISVDIVNNGKGRGGVKGMHGFIAEVSECGIGNAREQIVGKVPIYKWINDNGPVDLIIIVVCIFIFFIFSMVSSTSEVSKKLLFSS